MTREEAIEILQGAIKKPNTKDGYLGQAIDMAIKALEQMPCEDATNGEVLLKMFPPSVYFSDDEKHIVLLTKDCELTCYNNDWWNAPYERSADETDN